MKVISKIKLLRPSKCFLKFHHCFNLLLFAFEANSKFLFQIEASSVAIIPSSP